MNDDLFFSDITTLSRMLRRRKVSAAELAAAYCDRLEDLGPDYNALAELTRPAAMAQARRADRTLKSGDAPPLTGIPWGAKDLLDTAGIPTRWGAPPYKDRVPDTDATVVTRLRGAGAVLCAKLAMIELAGGGGYGSAGASIDGPCRNPWNLDHWAGGSSSGSGAAVAAGLVAFALGSETSGSIMSPSGWCGISGLRPTWGAVSRHGAMALSWSADKVGPMCRTAEDCATVFAAISGRDHLDPTTADYTFEASRARKFTLGVLPADLEGPAAKAFDDALRVLRRIGCRIVRVKLPNHEYGRIALPIMSAEWATAHRELIESDRLDDLVDDGQKEGLRRALQMHVADYASALERRVAATRDLRALFADKTLDALVSPTLLDEAPRLDIDLRTGRRAGMPAPKRRPRRRRGGAYAVIGAVTGLPALSVPMGFGKRGLPLGLCFTGDLFGEATILRLGAVYQRETDWHRRRPPMRQETKERARPGTKERARP